MVKGLLKKAVSSIPKVSNALKKVHSLAKKAVSAIASMLKAGVNKAKNSVSDAFEKLKDKISETQEEINEKNKRILEKIKAEGEKASSTIRGKTTIGGILLKSIERTIFPAKDAFVMLNFILESRQAVIEEYPILNYRSNNMKESIETLKGWIVDGGQKAGKWVYDLDIPVVSDFVGEFTEVRGDNAESNYITQRAAFYRGFWVNGVLGTIEGLANLAADPLEAARGISRIAAYLEESIPAIYEEVKKYVDEKLINGTAEDRAEFAGQITFEVVLELLTVGAGKAATAANATDKVKDTATILDKANDTVRLLERAQDAASLGDKTSDTARLLDKVQDTAGLGDKTKDAASLANRSEDIADASKVDNFNEIAKNNTNNYLEDLINGKRANSENGIKMDLQFFAEKKANNLENIAGTVNKANDVTDLSKTDNFNKMAKKNIPDAKEGGKGVNIKGGVPEENVNNIKNNVLDEVVSKTDEAEKVDKVNEALKLTPKDVPSVRNGEFNKWFDELDLDILNEIWTNPKLRKVKDTIKDRIRHPSGYHEWLVCEKAPKFKEWGVSMDEIKELRTLTDDVYFLNPDGAHHCSTGGKIAHQELFELVDNVNSFDEFKKALAEWADTKLKSGRNSLPKGLLDFD